MAINFIQNPLFDEEKEKQNIRFIPNPAAQNVAGINFIQNPAPGLTEEEKIAQLREAKQRDLLREEKQRTPLLEQIVGTTPSPAPGAFGRTTTGGQPIIDALGFVQPTLSSFAKSVTFGQVDRLVGPLK